MDIEKDERLKQDFKNNCENNENFLQTYLSLLEIKKINKKDLFNLLVKLKTTWNNLKIINQDTSKRLSSIDFKCILKPIDEDDFYMDDFINNFLIDNMQELKYEKICLKEINKIFKKLHKNNFDSISIIYFILESIQRFQLERISRFDKYDLIMNAYHKGINVSYGDNVVKNNLESLKKYSYILGYKEYDFSNCYKKENKK